MNPDPKRGKRGDSFANALDNLKQIIESKFQAMAQQAKKEEKMSNIPNHSSRF